MKATNQALTQLLQMNPAIVIILSIYQAKLAQKYRNLNQQSMRKTLQTMHQSKQPLIEEWRRHTLMKNRTLTIIREVRNSTLKIKGSFQMYLYRASICSTLPRIMMILLLSKVLRYNSQPSIHLKSFLKFLRQWCTVTTSKQSPCILVNEAVTIRQLQKDVSLQLWSTRRTSHRSSRKEYSAWLVQSSQPGSALLLV